jgi:hypothetical protein
VPAFDFSPTSTTKQAAVRRDSEAIPDKHCRHFLRSLVFSRSATYCDKSPTMRMRPLRKLIFVDVLDEVYTTAAP